MCGRNVSIFMKSYVSVSKALSKRSEGEATLALWSELAPDIEELDMYGGGDYATEDLVAELLSQIRGRLESIADTLMRSLTIMVLLNGFECMPKMPLPQWDDLILRLSCRMYRRCCIH